MLPAAGSGSNGAVLAIDKLSKKYLGIDRYPRRSADEVRVLYRIVADSVGSMG